MEISISRCHQPIVELPPNNCSLVISDVTAHKSHPESFEQVSLIPPSSGVASKTVGSHPRWVRSTTSKQQRKLEQVAVPLPVVGNRLQDCRAAAIPTKQSGGVQKIPMEKVEVVQASTEFAEEGFEHRIEGKNMHRTEWGQT